MGTSAQDWDVYVSYDPGVEDRAGPVLDLLRAHHVAVRPEQVLPPARFGGLLSETIRQAKALVLILTQDTGGSNWVRLDLTLALEFGKPVVGVLLDPATDIDLPDRLSADHCVFWSPTDPSAAAALGRKLGEVTGGAVGTLACSTPGAPASGAPELPFRAYRGEEDGSRKPYIFVSYAHLDSEAVFADIGRLHDQGYRIWYDEGISGGADWVEALATAVEEASLFLLFISPQSMQSKNVKNELQWACEHELDIVPVWLEDTELPKGVAFVLVRLNRIEKHRMGAEQYFRTLCECLPPQTSTAEPVLRRPPAQPAAPVEAPAPQAGGAEIQLSYMLTWTLDRGQTWRALDAAQPSSAVPAEAYLRAIILPSAPCRAALIIESEEAGAPEPHTTVWFARPRDGGGGEEWSVLDPLRWQLIPSADGLRERQPWAVPRWRIGILAIAAQDDRQPDTTPRPPLAADALAIDAAKRARAVTPCTTETMGRIQRMRYKLQDDAAPVAILLADDALIYWTEVRFA